MAFQTQRKSARNLVLAANRQAAPAGILADAALIRRQEFDGSSMPDLTATRRNNKNMAGKGTQFATSSIITSWDSKFPFKADADEWLLGWALAFVFGSDLVTGAAAPFLHTFSFDFTTDDAPITNVYVEDSNDVKYRLVDMAVSDVTITIPKTGVLTLDISLIGTGRWQDGAMAALPSAPVTFRYLLGSDAVFSLGPAAVNPLPVLAGRHQMTTIKIATGAVNHQASGNGLFGYKVRRGDLSFSVSTTVAVQQSDDIRTLINNDTLAAMGWVVNSGPQATFTFSIPAMKLKANKLGSDGEMLVWQFSADETTIESLGGAPAIVATLSNSVPSYLGAV